MNNSTLNNELIADNHSELSSDDEIENFEIIGDRRGDRIWRPSGFSPILHDFIGETGEKDFNIESDTPSEYFRWFFDEEMIQFIVDQTNLYQRQNPLLEQRNMASWTDVSIDEMYAILALTMLTELVNKNCVQDYWSTDPLIQTPFIAKIFTRNRCLQIMRFLHFADNLIDSPSKLAKIDDFIDKLKLKFNNCIHPRTNLRVQFSLL